VYLVIADAEKMFHQTDVPTKRDLMRAILSIFNPLDFLAAVVFQEKFLMQDIWWRKFDWNMKLDKDLIDRSTE